MVSERWWKVYEYENYDGCLNCFVDSINFCIANIIGTFWQSDMPLLRFIPLRRSDILSFWLSWGKFGTKLEIFLNKVSLEELKAGHSNV